MPPYNSFITWVPGLKERIERTENMAKWRWTDDIICEVECPSCGKVLSITNMRFTPCPCGGAIAELTVNWEIIEDEDEDND